MNTFTATVSGRLDKILATQLDVSRNQIEKLVKDGLVSVNDKTIIKNSFKVSEGDRVSYIFKEAEKRVAPPIDFDVEILYEDEYLLVVNKPAGLVVHPAPSVNEPTLVDWLIHKGISLSTISGEERYGIVHRIDKETTGALVVAKDNKAHEALSLQLQDKSMGRYYLALIDCPLKDDIVVDKPIGRNPKNRLKMDVIPDGRNAKTAFVKLLTSQHNVELIAAKLFTGRTHQIRVDKIYRVNLHAYLLYLVHPVTGERMEFVAPLFDDMKMYISKNFDQGEVDEKIDPHTLGSRFNNL
jgi:23S rRNA pseudouridine1911/1915/1917 synthase